LDENTKKQLELHNAGATVRHISPFEELEAYRNEAPMDNAFVKKWVVPVYLKGLREEAIEAYRTLVPQLTDDIVLNMLGEFNWRPRKAGAYFAAITQCVQAEDVIGTHLLKSEVCYAGAGYCVALAAFETKSAQLYVRKYLDYYLQRSDLDFDQSTAMGALAYMDEIHGSNHFTEFETAYELWREQAPHRRRVEAAISRFKDEMAQLAHIRETI